MKNAPIFKDLKEHLKDPTHYESIERTLFKTVQTKHRHKTLKQYVKCKDCSAKHKDKEKMIQTIGFKSVAQYLQWKKVMDIMLKVNRLKNG